MHASDEYCTLHITVMHCYCTCLACIYLLGRQANIIFGLKTKGMLTLLHVVFMHRHLSKWYSLWTFLSCQFCNTSYSRRMVHMYTMHDSRYFTIYSCIQHLACQHKLSSISFQQRTDDGTLELKHVSWILPQPPENFGAGIGWSIPNMLVYQPKSSSASQKTSHGKAEVSAKSQLPSRPVSNIFGL